MSSTKSANEYKWALNLSEEVFAKVVEEDISLNFRRLLSKKVIFCNLFIMSQFNYCSQILMFRNKKIQDKIDRLQKRVLWIIYKESILNLDELVELEKGT